MKVVAEFSVEIEFSDTNDRRPAEGDIPTDTNIADIIRDALYDHTPFYYQDIHVSVVKR